MFYTADETLDRFIKEDLPYIDLTSLVLEIGDQNGRICFTSREHAIICGSEEVIRIFNKLGAETVGFSPSGTCVSPGETFLEARGRAECLHMAWKVSMNILEYYSGIATRTRKLVDRVKAVSPKTELVTTRKLFPGTKELAVKAVVAGGGLPHRLGLSETILIFKQHLNFMGGIDGLLSRMEAVKARACEKKVIVETECEADAIKLCRAGADGIQFDKIPPVELGELVQKLRVINSNILLIATGGINDANVEEYAKTGVNSISTSWIYSGRPVDIGVDINIV
ncbi:putative nicotinate-nucleotide pyrophosphorylase [Ruminiclostridium hungatei]|uniref:Putative pyrophosphorylase ModD n=1 Tax=Ruminiclostridium hungatei TaxID=48256 RepID=A0A1V4SEN3_RUMHU|nr:ModD protein [Ruminiclostridium hungatei]OPX42310.1 putative nicotinate-nucleotide pyrophosphorylase [Ruminiclostridium hungatei]